MTPRTAILPLMLLALGAMRISALGSDTASVRSGYAPILDSARVTKTVATVIKADTAIVRAYNGIPVFYHCRPLHAYTKVGVMTRTTLVSYLSQAFDKYTKAARRKAQGHLGIIIDNMNFGADSFDVVRFSPADGNADTAVFTTPIFLSARPTRPYKVIRIVKDQFGAGSLNANLQNYYNDAKQLHLSFDAIMVKDINYMFSRDNIYMVRWKKPETK